MKNHFFTLFKRLHVTFAISICWCYAYGQSGIPIPGRYIAIGSSLSAGVRDGGLSAERQKTAFPILLAQQIGIKDFHYPSIRNTGELSVIQNRNLGLSYKWISEPQSSISLDRGINPSNLAIPFQKVTTMALNFDKTVEWPGQYGKESFKYLNGLLKENEKLSYSELIDKESSDVAFFSYELGFDDFVEYFKSGGFGTNLQFFMASREGNLPENELIKTLVNKKARGVILNLPEISELPFFSAGRFEEINHLTGEVIYAEKYSKAAVKSMKEGEILIPGSPSYQSAIVKRDGYTGYQQDNPLVDEDVITQEELVSVKVYNQLLENIASKNKLPIVDLFSLYSKINSGTYYSFDNVLIDPTYPGGNFYSADGIYPTSLGQAVIANEIISTINAHFNLEIPRISIRNFTTN